jgi:hypothetical protein
MSTIEILQVLTGLVIAVFCVAAVPWAMRIGARIASIDTTLKEREWQEEEIVELRKQVQQIEVRCAGRSCVPTPDP